MSRIPDEFIDALLARTDIVEVVQARVPLKRAGREYQARCPFHEERSPSFTVSPTKQFFHCFGCGAHGSAIRFVMDFDRLEFVDAVELLAKAAGMPIPRDERSPAAPSRDPVYAILERAGQFFRDALESSPQARDYLAGRAITAESCEVFGIGYAPDSWSQLIEALGGQPALPLLQRAGLVSTGEHGRVYDRFRDRIMFPILDRRGRTVGFGGRYIGPHDAPKYLNSPETEVFHKGRELFGLHQARMAQQHLSRLVVVEGYLDVVTLRQAGLVEVVAPLGTALTAEQAQLLYRSTDQIVVALDGDAAGAKASARVLHELLPLMSDGRQAAFASLTEGDPDGLVRERGLQAFTAQLDAALPLSDFLFATAGEGIELAAPEGRAKLAAKARPMIDRLPDGVFRQLMEQALAERVRVAAAPPTRTQRPRPSRAPSLVRTAVRHLLARPALLIDHPLPALDHLDLPGTPVLVALAARAAQVSHDPAALREALGDFDEADYLLRLAACPLPVADDVARLEWQDILRALADQDAAMRRAHLLEARRSRSLDPAELDELRRLLARS